MLYISGSHRCAIWDFGLLWRRGRGIYSSVQHPGRWMPKFASLSITAMFPVHTSITPMTHEQIQRLEPVNCSSDSISTLVSTSGFIFLNVPDVSAFLSAGFRNGVLYEKEDATEIVEYVTLTSGLILFVQFHMPIFNSRSMAYGK